ncbi:MAG: hypothetical protein WAL25_13980 [Acidimicrobiia bacterium]
MSDQSSTKMANRAFAIRPVLTTWALTVGVDLFFNAGVFMPLFDQEREPSLIPDEQLVRRIPVAYLGLLAGVTSLAWIIDRIDLANARYGVMVGTLAGLVFSLMGVIYLWTAIEMTAWFVAAGSLVVIVEFASAGWALSAFRRNPDTEAPTRRILLIALLAAVAGIVIQNLQT